jgi:hypothetical protein
MPGDYARAYPIYGGIRTDVDLPSAFALVVPSRANVRLAIQKIVFSPSVYVSAILSFYDSITLVVIGTIQVPAVEPAAGDGSDINFLDFGSNGTLLSLNASLLYSVTANGAQGRLHVDSFNKGPFVRPALPVFPMTAGFTTG